MARVSYIRRFVGDLFAFAREHKAYWILPLVLVLLLAAVLAMTSQAAAPFVYTLF